MMFLLNTLVYLIGMLYGYKTNFLLLLLAKMSKLSIIIQLGTKNNAMVAILY